MPVSCIHILLFFCRLQDHIKSCKPTDHSLLVKKNPFSSLTISDQQEDRREKKKVSNSVQVLPRNLSPSSCGVCCRCLLKVTGLKWYQSTGASTILKYRMKLSQILPQGSAVLLFRCTSRVHVCNACTFTSCYVYHSAVIFLLEVRVRMAWFDRLIQPPAPSMPLSLISGSYCMLHCTSFLLTAMVTPVQPKS